MIETFTKQPADVIDYDFDFGKSWMPSGDTIASAVAAADTGITLGATSINSATSVVKQWLSGGASGVKYKCKITITTTAGRVKEQDFYVKVKEI